MKPVARDGHQSGIGTGKEMDVNKSAGTDIDVGNATLEDITERIERDGLPLGDLVEHANGHLGWIIYRDDVGLGLRNLKKGRPTYKVVTLKGQRTWWYQDRCKLVEPRR